MAFDPIFQSVYDKLINFLQNVRIKNLLLKSNKRINLIDKPDKVESRG